MNTAALAKLAGLGQDTRMRGFGVGDSIEQGDYHVVGTNVILRAGPSSTTNNIGTMNNGEGVYAFGDVEVDAEHMIGPGGVAVPNDGSSPGIEYVHVGTQTHGAGWIAMHFIAPGAGGAAQPKPTPTPAPTPSPTPAPPVAMAKKDKVATFLIGGLIGVAVLGGVVLLVKHTKSPRRLAHA
jgi:hypothetical protein